jgi:hypothetical protein
MSIAERKKNVAPLAIKCLEEVELKNIEKEF